MIQNNVWFWRSDCWSWSQRRATPSRKNYLTNITSPCHVCPREVWLTLDIARFPNPLRKWRRLIPYLAPDLAYQQLPRLSSWSLIIQRWWIRYHLGNDSLLVKMKRSSVEQSPHGDALSWTTHAAPGQLGASPMQQKSCIWAFVYLSFDW